MTKTDKILACRGRLSARSIAKILGCSKSFVYNVWSDHDIKVKVVRPQEHTAGQPFPRRIVPVHKDTGPGGGTKGRKGQKEKNEPIKSIEIMSFIYKVFLVAAIWLESLIFSKLWLWFLVPIFGLRPITVAESLGILFVITFLKNKNIKKLMEEDDREYIDKILDSFRSMVLMIVLWGFGALLYFILIK